MSARNGDTDIAVIGMGCRFPQAQSVEEFWQNLLANKDCITPVPEERFDITPYYAQESGTPGRTVSRHGGFLREPFAFDTGYFGISPAEAATIDPQHRLLLPVVREALEGAGIRPSTLAGSTTGVYIGQATADYARNIEAQDGQGVTLRESAGSYFRAMAAGRISYDLDVNGPSLTVDTACSSSLVAVHTARQSLLAGETDLAIAGGVNIILSPLDAIAYSQAAMLSPDGRCKFGDSSADGFVRSEGIGVVVLARLSDARRAGHRVLAVLAGSAVTNDGRGSGSVIKPAVTGQTEMLRRAWRDAAVTPCELDYVEAHGTGTPVGDTVELQALVSLADERPKGSRPLRTGSVKSNIGHTEAAAGIAGLIKAVLIAQHGLIPASLHLSDPQDLLIDEAGPVQVVTSNEPLGNDAAHIGVSSFGLSGTNAHIVVAGTGQEPPTPRHGPTELPAGRPTHLLVLSARSRQSLLRQARRYAAFLAPTGAGRGLPLWDVCATAALHRDAHPYRLWATGADHDELSEALLALAEDRGTERAGTGEAGFGAPKRTVFVFPGQGSQWPGMGRSLLASTPAYAATLDACDAAARAETGRSVRELLAEGRDFPDDVATVQPVLWATEVALASAWGDMGVVPDACIGHSMGEVAAATVAGSLTHTDAAAVICRRSALMQHTAGQGAMMSIELSAQQALDLIAGESGICVAADNAPTSTVLAGDRAALERIGRRLEQDGVFHRLVRVNVASHSPAMDPLRDELLTALAGLSPRRGAVPLHSTVHDALVDGSRLDAAYWMDNLRRPVRFLDGVRHLAKEAESLFVEISPHPILQMAVEETLQESGGSSAAVASTTRHTPDEALALARSLGAFFALGGQVDWERWFRGPAHRVQLPAYAWDEDVLRHAQHLAERRPAQHSSEIRADLRGAVVRLRGDALLPPAVCLAALHEATGSDSVTIEDARVGESLIEVPDDRSLTLRVATETTRDGSVTGVVHVVAAGQHGAQTGLTARVRTGVPEGRRDAQATLHAALKRCRTHRTPTQFLRDLACRGYEPDAALRTVRHVWRRGGEAVAQLSLPDTSAHGAWEACLMPLLAAVPGLYPADTAYAVTGFEQVSFHRPLTAELWVHASFKAQRSGRTARATVTVLDAQGTILAQFRGIRLRRLAPPATAANRRPAWDLVERVSAGLSGRGPVPQSALTRLLNALPEQRMREPLPRDGHRPVPVLGAVPAQRTGAPAAPAPRTDPGEQFLATVAHVLGMPVERLDVRRSLKDYGIDSLSAAKLRGRIQRQIGKEISLTRLLSEDSVRTLAAEVTDSQSVHH